MVPPEAVRRLREHLERVVDLRAAAAVLGWDKQTYMPPGSGAVRARQVATLRALAHEMFTARRTAELLEAAEAGADTLDPDSDEAALVRVVRRDFDRAVKLPSDFVAEFARAAALSNEVWRRARPADDFAAFRPHLEQMVDFSRRTADFIGYVDHPYDALLDQHEPGLRSADLREIFRQIREGVTPLLRAIMGRGAMVRDDVLHKEYGEAAQEGFGRAVAAAFGYDFTRGRLDVSPHPFTTGFGRDDVRITTRYNRRFLWTGISAIFHETGHALYGQGTAPSLDRTPLAGAASGGFSESQSRLYEHLLGGSRAFWAHYFPVLQDVFPEQLHGVDAEEFYRAINRVQPSIIRVDADEVTYNMHIILRVDLELQLIEGSLAVRDLPAQWDELMEAYLGVVPPNDADGVLQDIHWSGGGFAVFPNYTLGNVISAQLFEAALAVHPSLPDEIARGRFETLLAWLREHVHRHGRKFLPDVLLKRATGRVLTAEPYLRYLRTKFGDIYGVRMTSGQTAAS